MEVKDLKLEFVVDAAGFAPDTFMVVDFEGEERISQPFRFEVNLVSYEPDLDLADVANKEATLEVHRDDEKLIFHGQVAHFDQGPYVGDRYFYTAVLRPDLWYLSLRYQSRIFRDMSIPDVITKVLEDAGFSSQQYKLELEGQYPVREYTVQYHETDLDFVMRWAEHVGIRFHFEGDMVVFSDKAPATAPFIPGEVLVFNPGGGLGASQEAVRRFNCREQVVTGKVVLKDYNYRTPETVLEAESQINSDMPGVRYEFGQHFKDVDEGKHLAKVRNEEIECQRRIMWGESGYVGMHAGYKMTMKQHYRPSLNGDFLLTYILHRGTQGASVPGLSKESAKGVNVYTNEFSCLPLDIMYRPPRVTPKPQIPGIMSGRIESAGGDYSHIDEEGRYRSRMYFDRGEAGTAEATHPVRMNQPYSGPDYGIHFPNHKNTEMLVAHVDGNPDRPLALGTSPNPSNKAPAVSGNKWQNVVRTWGGNQMIMDDTKEKQWIQINTPAKNMMLFTDDEDHILIATTNMHQMIFDDKNKHITVQTTDGHFLTMDDDKKLINLQSKDGHRVTINDEKKLMTVTDSKEDHRFQIDIGNKKITIETVNGDIDILAKQGHIQIESKTLTTKTTDDTEHISDGNIKCTAAADHTITAGGNIKCTAAGDYSEEATNVKSTAAVNHENTAGANYKATAGAMMDAKAGAIHTIQGATVLIN